MAPVKYKTRSLPLKVKILEAVKAGGKSKTQIAKDFNISKSTLSTYLKNEGKIIGAYDKLNDRSRKNIRSGLYPKLEEALELWVKKARQNGIPISGGIMKAKAEEMSLRLGINGFKYSDGWLRGFKKRFGLSFKKICGESAAVDLKVVEDWKRDKLQDLLADYSPDDVFNCDETGLFYKMLPDQTLAFKGEPCSGGKRSKERLTIMVGTNMSGTEKLPLLVIGKAAKPRCFKGLRSLPVDYESNRKAWVTTPVFDKYIRSLDRKFEIQKRKVLMFADNCTAHGNLSNLKAIRLEFLPPNTTSILQPMDQGVIRCLKAEYRKRLLESAILFMDNGKLHKVDILRAIRFVADGWKAIEAKSIANAFKKAGFYSTREAGLAKNGADDASDDEGECSADDQEDDDSNAQITECEEANEIGAAALMDRAASLGLVPRDVTFTEYVDVDANLELCADELSVEQIVQQVQDNDESEPEALGEEDGQSVLQVPSSKDVFDALSVLRAYYESGSGSENSENRLEMISAFERDLFTRQHATRQVAITSFFKTLPK